MLWQKSRDTLLFEQLCEEYYEKIWHYLYAILGEEVSARDCLQEVFLVACQKRALLRSHPNPGGFLFQTAKNIVKKHWRESYQKMMRDVSLEENTCEWAATDSEIVTALDRRIDEQRYIDVVLSQLSEEKQRLYALYYLGGRSMAEIAAMLGTQETTLRMRYVRLRRQIRELVAEVAKAEFDC